MTDEPNLIEAAMADPEDDTCLLALADLLQEQGRERDAARLRKFIRQTRQILDLSDTPPDGLTARQRRAFRVRVENRKARTREARRQVLGQLRDHAWLRMRGCRISKTALTRVLSRRRMFGAWVVRQIGETRKARYGFRTANRDP
jgi:uncharacterized protein (TIGR02996 family)